MFLQPLTAGRPRKCLSIDPPHLFCSFLCIRHVSYSSSSFHNTNAHLLMLSIHWSYAKICRPPKGLKAHVSTAHVTFMCTKLKTLSDLKIHPRSCRQTSNLFATKMKKKFYYYVVFFFLRTQMHRTETGSSEVRIYWYKLVTSGG